MRKLSFVILLLSAIASLVLVLNSGRHAPVLLLLLFVGWVLSPFAALLLLKVVSELQSVIDHKLLSTVMLFISVGSLASYFITFIQHNTKPPTAVYLAVPFISWLLIMIAIAITTYRERTISKK